MRRRLMVSAEGQRDEDRDKGPAGHDEASERAVPGRIPHGEVPAGPVPALALARISGSIALSSLDTVTPWSPRARARSGSPSAKIPFALIGRALASYDATVLITEVPADSTERTWRPPVTTRMALAACLAVVTALPGLWLALTLVTNQVPEGDWIALASAVTVWGLLAWRVLAQSVTLTPDTLVIRNILATERVPLAGVTEVGFHGGRLTVTAAHGAAGSQRLTVDAVNLGPSRWSGLRSNADAIAAAITDAAGLPPLPPRGEVISRNWAWIMLLAAVLCFALGVHYGPPGSGNAGLSRHLREVGIVLDAVGAGLLGLALRVTRDHRRKRTQQAAADE